MKTKFPLSQAFVPILLPVQRNNQANNPLSSKICHLGPHIFIGCLGVIP
jgi:hypothetical protein